MPNPFVHVELSTTDLDKAKAFYTKLFDWDLKDMPMPNGNYTMIGVGQGTGGGMMHNSMPGLPSVWVPYVDVLDIHASTAQAKSLGANVMLDSMEVPGMGWCSMLIDPTGAPIGLWQNKTA